MNELIQMTFDYSVLSPEQARRTQEAEYRLIGRTQKTIVENGRDLDAVKQDIGHGHFRTWVQSIGISHDTAERWINISQNFAEMTPGASFAEKAMALLSTSKVPESAREEAKQRAEDGEKITEEVAKQIRDAHRAKEKAEEAERKTRADLTRQIEELQQEMETLTTPEVEIREVAQPADKAEIEKLQKRVNELTTQRDNLSKEAEELGAIAREAAIKRDARENEERIRQQWRTACVNFNQSILKTLSQWPTPIDTQVFEADDWSYLSQVKETARRFMQECNNLNGESLGLIIDAVEA